ncbi:hypothetical protein BDZ91DRAFT_745970 [Kalaharituber pfeilii]|nr:hypothetical protein BDZ91DRAFT_745970 [Kalaharituber pfeilii]
MSSFLQGKTIAPICSRRAYKYPIIFTDKSQLPFNTASPCQPNPRRSPNPNLNLGQKEMQSGANRLPPRFPHPRSLHFLPLAHQLHHSPRVSQSKRGIQLEVRRRMWEV